MVVSFRFYRPDDSDLARFIHILTTNNYKVEFEQNGTKNLIARVTISDSQVRDTEAVEVAPETKSYRSCGNCPYNDGKVYTSIPPMRRCKVTGQFHNYQDICNVDDENIRIYDMSEAVKDDTKERTITSIYDGNVCLSGGTLSVK